jgi:hypothetical protein
MISNAHRALSSTLSTPIEQPSEKLPDDAYIVLTALRLRYDAAVAQMEGLPECAAMLQLSSQTLARYPEWTRHIAIALLRNRDGITIEDADSFWLESKFMQHPVDLSIVKNEGDSI